MMLSKCGYCLRSALQNMSRNLILNLLSMSTIAVTFIVFISFLLVLLNVSALKNTWAEEMQVTAYFDAAAKQPDIEKSRAAIEIMPEVASATFISRDEALSFLQDSLEGQDGLLEGLSSNPLPPSIELKLKPGHAAPRTSAFDSFIARLRSIDTVDDVEYGQKWLDRFGVLTDSLTCIGICLGGLLFLFTLFIITNTIRLMVYIRREEIEIMRLVGATHLFIKAPFCFEGIIHGTCGSAAALVTLFAAQQLFFEKAEIFVASYLGPQPLIGIHFSLSLYSLLLGAALGFMGSLLAIGSLDEMQR